MPAADATLLPPPMPTESNGPDPHAGRSLEAVGVTAVLGAMIEQRRSSQPSFASIVVPAAREREEEPTQTDDGDDEITEPDVRERTSATSDVFLKAR